MSIHKLIGTDIPLVIMRDTNIDTFLLLRDISSYLEGLNVRQILYSSTRDYGSCLDHAYTTDIHVKFRYFLCKPRIILFKSQTNHCIFAPVREVIPTNQVTLNFIVPLNLLYLKNVTLKLMCYVFKFIIFKNIEISFANFGGYILLNKFYLLIMGKFLVQLFHLSKSTLNELKAT